jgi:iron-sulfur cluster assembly accessory protein
MDQDRQHESLSQTAEPLLTVTAAAVAMIKQNLERMGFTDGGVRMTVAGGGCEGFQYTLNLTQATRTDDEVIVQDGIKAFLDPFSARHLRGTKLDYVHNRHGTGFQFFGIASTRTFGCASPILLRRCIEGNTRTKGCTESAKRPLLELGIEVAQPVVERKTSISHPGLRPRSICPTCRYIVCRCEAAA